MSEVGNSNIEVAHRLSHDHKSSQLFAHQMLEITEAIVRAIVAIAQTFPRLINDSR
jgi:hypothetical protein